MSHAQVYSHGLRVIMKGQPPQEWRAPGKKQIEKACANERQVVLALAGGEIIFFELDEAMQNIQASAGRRVTVRVGGTRSRCLTMAFRSRPPHKIVGPMVCSMNLYTQVWSTVRWLGCVYSLL